MECGAVRGVTTQSTNGSAAVRVLLRDGLGAIFLIAGRGDDLKKIGIYGAGGFGRQVAWLLKAPASRSSFDPVCFVEDGATGERVVSGLTTLSLEAFARSYADASITVAVGSPALRRRLVAKCEAVGLGFATLIAHDVEMSTWVSLGAGVTISPGCILTVDVVLERHVQLNKDCTIGYDVRIGEFSTLSPGVHVSGNVRIGRDVFIGAGATIANDIDDRPLVIGDSTVIAAGACVTADTEESGLYVGVPAVLKKRYDSLPA